MTQTVHDALMTQTVVQAALVRAWRHAALRCAVHDAQAKRRNKMRRSAVQSEVEMDSGYGPLAGSRRAG